MSQPTVRLCGVALPGGGTVVLSDVSPGGIVPRVELATHATHPPQFDPDGAGGLGEALLCWAIERGHRPHPSTQVARWELPDVDLLAVLVERVLTGEEPTVVGLERYAAAYREAHRVASALPEVLGLLEELNPRPDEEAAEAATSGVPEGLGVVQDFGRGPGGPWTGRGRADDDARTMEAFDVAYAAWNTENGGLIDAVRAVVQWADDQTPVDAARASREAMFRPSVPLAPMPTVRDLGLVLDTVEAAERNAVTWNGQVSAATRRLRASFDAAQAARVGYLAELDGRLAARTDPDRDPVEDQDGAPLPESVQRLVLLAEWMLEVHEGGSAVDEANAYADLAAVVSDVRSESRR